MPSPPSPTPRPGEEMHLASLINLAFGFAHVQSVDEWLADLDPGQASGP